ncbi:hypothetical protein N9K44_03140 [Flavobacteriaceae bacterium]|nr:hypothetical protein [Flavobacteriaceae bacterium]
MATNNTIEGQAINLPLYEIAWEVAIYDGYASHRSYDGIVRMWGEDDNQEWSVYCHNAFEELEEGELPGGV